MPSGLVLLDKPQGFTSHDAVAKLRRLLGTRKIGHAGTLDPMATGLLVLGVDAGTKLLQFLVGVDKQYIATIRLGQSTTTDDAEGDVLISKSAKQIGLEDVLGQIKKLTGDILQIPSKVSAIKVDGKRAYDLVREGKEVELKARPVTVSRFDVLGEPRFDGDFLDLDVIVDCSTGTYIRALARDLGEALGVGGHLTALRRTKVGSYSIDRAIGLAEEVSVLDLGDAARALFPALELNSQQEVDLIHGKRIDVDGPKQVCAFFEGRLVAILEQSGSSYKSLVVFPKDSNG
ncbi:MAG: tRNA pseudouridine(55) synthase TruB [Actinomycetota bacterium]